MTPFEVYSCYLSFKNHFTKPNYDYLKYNGKTRTTVSSFNKRKDKYFFEKMSRQRSDDEIKEYFIANFIECSDPARLWIGEIIQSGDNNYKNWQKRIQSLTYRFTDEVTSLFDNHEFDKIFECKNGHHPLIFKELLSKRISIETMVILDKILKFVKDYDMILLDPVWESYSLKIKKYSPFLRVDIKNFKTILKEKVING